MRLGVQQETMNEEKRKPRLAHVLNWTEQFPHLSGKVNISHTDLFKKEYTELEGVQVSLWSSLFD